MLKKVLFLSSALLLLSFAAVQAAPPDVPGAGGAATVDSLFNKFIQIVQYIFGIAFGVGLIMVVWGGIEWMTAGGDATKIGAARNKLLYGIIGMIVIFGILTLIKIVADFLDIPVPDALFGLF